MQVNMHEAKTQLSALAERASKGERVIIAKAGEPFVELVPVRPAVSKKRELGKYRGQVWFAPDYAEADQEIERMFYGEDAVEPPQEPLPGPPPSNGTEDDPSR